MGTRAEALFAVEEQAQKCRLQEKSEHAFHGQSLADDAAGEAREDCDQLVPN